MRWWPTIHESVSQQLFIYLNTLACSCMGCKYGVCFDLWNVSKWTQEDTMSCCKAQFVRSKFCATGPWISGQSFLREGEILRWWDSSRLVSLTSVFFPKARKDADVDLRKGKEGYEINANRWMASGGAVCQIQNWSMVEVENDERLCRKGEKVSVLGWWRRKERVCVAN